MQSAVLAQGIERRGDYRHASDYQHCASGLATGCGRLRDDLSPVRPEHDDQLGNRSPERRRDGFAYRLGPTGPRMARSRRGRSGHRLRYGHSCIGCLRTHGRLRRVSTSAATVIAQAAAAGSTQKCWIGSPSAAIDKLSPALRNPTRPAMVFIDPSGFRMLACTGASNGNTTAGTTSHGCNSICSALPTRVDPLVQLLKRADPGSPSVAKCDVRVAPLRGWRRRLPSYSSHHQPAVGKRRKSCCRGSGGDQLRGHATRLSESEGCHGSA